MKARATILMAVAVITAVLAAGPTAPHTLAASCGPGAHWVDFCAAGTDHFDDTVATVGIDVDFDCVQDVAVTLTGPLDVHRDAGAPHMISTEIVSMELSGELFGSPLTLRAGFYNPNYAGGQHSYGAVVEQGGNPALADSFFDVFFEVAGGGLPPGGVYNHDPHRMQAVIDRVPPEALYTPPGPLCLPVYDDPVGGMPWFNLVSAQHDTRPRPVGGTVELRAGSPDSPTDAADESGSPVPYAALAGAAAAALAVAAGGWYARRRWLR